MKKSIWSWLIIFTLAFSAFGLTFVCNAEKYYADDIEDDYDVDYEDNYEVEIEVAQKSITPIGVSGKIVILDSDTGEPYETVSENQIMPTVTNVEAVVENKTYTAKISDNNFFTISFGSDTYGYDTAVKINATISDGQIIKKTVKIKIQKSQKKYTFNISVSKYKTNQKIVAALYTKKNQKRVSVTSKVYLSDKIKINMTKSQVLNTDYGKPDEKYTSTTGNGSYEDWYYYDTHGYKIVLVSIYNGKVCQVTTHK